jgi:hypothetical protein
MALQFSLLGGPELILKTQPFKPINFMESKRAAYSMAGEMAENEEKLRRQREAQQDREILRQGIRDGSIDLFTPDGIQKSLETLRDKLSPDAYLRLGEQANKVRETDVAFKERVQRMDEIALKRYTSGVESAMPYLDALMKQYQQDVETGGEQSAQERFLQNRDKYVTQMRGRMVGPDTPMFNEQVMNTLSQITPELLPGMISASQYQAGVARNASLMAAARRTPTGAENFVTTEGDVVTSIPGVGLFNTSTEEPWTGDPATLRALPSTRGAAGAGVAGAGVTTLRGSDENQYRVNRRTGTTEILNRQTGAYDPLPGGIPPGVRVAEIGSAAESQMAARADRIVLTPEESARLSRISRMVRLNVPPFGQGEAGTNARNAFYKGLLADIDALGQGDTEAAIRMAMASASRKTRENIIQRDAVLRSEEDEAKALLSKIEEELKKIGGPASPYLREKWNTVETRLLGSPTFSQLNLYMTQFVDTVGRLSSNATGAAGTPVAYLNFAKTVLDKDFNLEQVKAFRPAFDNLLAARREGVKNAFTYLNDLGAAVPGAAAPGGAAAPAGGAPAAPGGAAAPAGGATPMPAVTARPTAPSTPAATTPGTQPTQNRVDVLQDEYNRAIQRLSTVVDTPEDPTARARAMDDARALRRELGRLGVQLPEPGLPAEPATPVPAAPSAADVRSIRRALQSQNMPYEPDKYDYRIGPDGKVLRKRK